MHDKNNVSTFHSMRLLIVKIILVMAMIVLVAFKSIFYKRDFESKEGLPFMGIFLRYPISYLREFRKQS